LTAADAADAAAAATLQWSYNEAGKVHTSIMTDLINDAAVKALREQVSKQ
jgi:hypothetical protein